MLRSPLLAYRVSGLSATRSAQQLGDAGEPLDQVVVAQGVREAQVARRAEGLARDDGDAGLVQEGGGQGDGRLRSPAPNLAPEEVGDGREGVEGPQGLGARD